MRVFFYELKKLWNWRILLLIAVTGILTWFAFLLPEVQDYNNNAENIYGDWQNEMFDLYGITLSAEELADFDIPGKRAALEAEMNAIIATEPLYAEYGVYTFDEYMAFVSKYNTDGMNDTEIQKYLADHVAMQNAIKDLSRQWRSLNSIEGYYVLFLERNIGMARDGFSRIISRAENHYINAAERNLTRYAIHDRFSFYAMVAGVFSVIAVILLTSPLVVTDRHRNITAMQYSSNKGRSILRIQGLACVFSALLLGLILVSISFGVFFELTNAGEYWYAYIGAFDRGIVLYDLLFSQYVLILGGMVIALCVGTAGLTFILSRFSSNIVTLMLKSIPMGLVVALIASQSIHFALVSINSIFSDLFHAKYDVPEVILCCAVMLIGITTVYMVAARERRVDV